MSNSNFLPEFKPKIKTADVRALRCIVRDKEVIANPEEEVRQRVLNWLIETCKWNRREINVESPYLYTSGRRGRSDIELIGDNGTPIVIVECKRAAKSIGVEDTKQAVRYANKCGANFIWATNGEQHHFQRKVSSGKWKDCESLDILDVCLDPPQVEFKVPKNLNAARFKTYMNRYPDYDLQKWYQSYRPRPSLMKDHYAASLVGILNLIHGPKISSRLPFRLSGVGLYILEDRGAAYHRFSTPGGLWQGLYRDVLATTEFEVCALSIGIQYWSYESPLRLCVGVNKRNRTHHALQLNIDNCELDVEHNCLHMWHNGVLGGRSKAASITLEAVREAGRHDLIKIDSGKEWIYLGPLYLPNSSKSNSRFLCNLLHYSIIRTELRESTN